MLKWSLNVETPYFIYHKRERQGWEKGARLVAAALARTSLDLWEMSFVRVGKDVERDEVPYLFQASKLPSGDLPAGPVVKAPCFQYRGTPVPSLVGEIGFYMPKTRIPQATVLPKRFTFLIKKKG